MLVASTKPRRAKTLPRGRHGLSTRAVQASQKDRLIRAILELVAAHGYARTTVPEVAARARVSPNAFYDFFSDKTDCFLAALAQEAGTMLREINAATAQGNWIERLERGLDAYLGWWQARPQETWAFFVEMPQVGERALAQREKAYVPFAEMFARIGAAVRRQQRKLNPLPAFVPRMVTVSITEFVADAVRAGRTAELMTLKPDLLFYLVKLLADDASAQRVAKPKVLAAR
jgi:AcrR family transcriptional regulator